MPIFDKNHIVSITRDMPESDVKRLIDSCSDFYINPNSGAITFDLPAKHSQLLYCKKQAIEAIKKVLDCEGFIVRFAVLTRWD